MDRFRRHVFVCDNRRPVGSRPSCANRGAGAILEALQRAVAARPDLWGAVAVTSCGCLGPCFEGPNLVVYPEGVWYSGVQASDIEDIVDIHLRGGQPIDRLRWRTDDDEDLEV